MQAEGAVAVEDVFDVSLLGDIVGHTLDSHHMLPSVLHHEGLSFEGWCEDLHHRVLLESQQGCVLQADGLSVVQRDAQFGVEGCEEVGHEVLETVEDAQRDHHCHCCHSYSKHRDAADDVDGMVALLGKEVAAGYEEFEPPPSPPKEG